MVYFENNSQVIRLLTELEPESLLLNAYEYRLSHEIETTVWKIERQRRKYGIRIINAQSRQEIVVMLALSHAICDRCKIVDLFDYQEPN